MSSDSAFIEAIESGQTDLVRQLLSSNKHLTTQKFRPTPSPTGGPQSQSSLLTLHRNETGFRFPPDLELESYKFIGAYLGSLTALQLAILLSCHTSDGGRHSRQHTSPTSPNMVASSLPNSPSGGSLSLTKSTFAQMALDIVDATLDAADLSLQCGSGNTALHLATFCSLTDVVERLLKRGVMDIKNDKGFKAVDIVDDDAVREVYAKYK